jgi:hypothetical protein
MTAPTRELTNEEDRRENLVAKATYDSARHLGSATRCMHDGVSAVGSFLKGCPRAVIRLPGALRRSVGRRSSPASQDVIRSIVTEELARVLGADAVARFPALEERLHVLAGTIVALQKRIDELSAHGPVTEADMLHEIKSLDVAESLSSEERGMLVKVFRQNMVLQKPELADTTVDGLGTSRP